MSASGFTPIQIYRTTTATAVPSAGNLADGELAINLTDEALYFKNAAGVVTLLADSSGALGSVTSVAVSGGTTGLTTSGGPITSSGTITLSGTLAVANGGTGVTTSTGTGSVVLGTSPTLVTPTLGAASATSIANALGAVGTPSYTFTGDLNTGMWSPAADTLALSTAGSERLRVVSSGNVGVGMPNPSAGRIVVRTASTTGKAFAADNTANTGFVVDFAPNITSIGNDFNNPLVFLTNNTERMRIVSSGNLRVGTTSFLVSANEKVSFDCGSTNGLTTKTSGGAAAWNYFAWNSATSGDNGFIEFGTEGSYTARGSITYNRGGGVIAYNTTSDYRSKDILGPVADPGATIDALKVYNGKMKGATIARPMLVAHEAQEVVPYAVTGEKDAVNEDGTDKYQQMDHQVLIPLLIAEIQSLRARVAQLERN